jgi:hypothetical protein
MLHVMVVALLAQGSAPTRRPKPQTADACTLLPDTQIRTVLGATVIARRPGTQHARGLLLAQCYLDTGTPRSVSIALAGPISAGDKTITPRGFWREQFHGRDERAAEREIGKRDRDRTAAANEHDSETGARPIAGVGDEAFWSGTRVAGALYVLRGDTFIRVSVGGIRDEQERIEMSRTLALAALAALQ